MMCRFTITHPRTDRPDDPHCCLAGLPAVDLCTGLGRRGDRDRQGLPGARRQARPRPDRSGHGRCAGLQRRGHRAHRRRWQLQPAGARGPDGVCDQTRRVPLPGRVQRPAGVLAALRTAGFAAAEVRRHPRHRHRHPQLGFRAGAGQGQRCGALGLRDAGVHRLADRQPAGHRLLPACHRRADHRQASGTPGHHPGRHRQRRPGPVPGHQQGHRAVAGAVVPCSRQPRPGR
ncbi:hypothetical protein D3C86_429420 [compost metagenome]